MKRALLLLLSLGVFVTGSGFKLLQNPERAWHQDDLPIEYVVGDSRPTGLDRDTAVELIEAAFDQWRDVPCSPIDGAYAGSVDNDVNNGFAFSSQSRFTFGDPGDQLGSGTIAAAVTHSGSNLAPNNGINFRRITALNIVYNTGFNFATPEQIDAPDCFRLTDFLQTTTHEIGHGLGFGHSCDADEPCPDPLLLNAVMYYSGPTCSSAGRVPNEDDIAAINTAYGIGVDFDIEPVEGSLVGPTPLTATMTVPDVFTEGVTRYTWNFGDGTERVVNSGPDPVTHTWEREGQFTVTLSIEGSTDECPDFRAESRKVGRVLACAPPTPEFRYTNEGDYTVQMENLSPLSAFGCVDEFEWVLDGDEGSALSTFEPRYVFDEAGEHTVLLRAIGPGGTTEFSGTIEVSLEPEGGCCNASVGAGRGTGAGLLLGLLGLVGLRRRR